MYEIGRVFRNEGLDTRHNPEFTLMELYQAYTDYYGMMDLTENLYRFVAQEVCGTTEIPLNGIETIDLGKPFERMTMVDAVKKYAGVDFDQIPIPLLRRSRQTKRRAYTTKSVMPRAIS